MSTVMDWQTIELPEGTDSDRLYDLVKDNPGLIDRLVKEILVDKNCLNDETNTTPRIEEAKKLIKDIEMSDAKFDALLEEYNKFFLNRKATTLTETIYIDDEYIYYSGPIETVIDIEELRQRMGQHTENHINEPSTSTQITVKTECHQNGKSEECQTVDDDEIMELSVVYNKVPHNFPAVKYQPFKREPPKVGDKVFAASNAILTQEWKPATISRIQNQIFVSVQFDDKSIVGGNLISHQLIAYNKPTVTPMNVGERVVAYLDVFNGRALYSGTIAEPARKTNCFRYLVFFDKHAYRYIKREDIFYIYIRPTVDRLFNVKEVGVNPELADYFEFLKMYIKKYPERPMLRLQVGDDRIKVRYQNKWESAVVKEVDASLALFRFEKMAKPHEEWIYRGSRRLYDIHKECPMSKTSNVKHRAGRSTTRVRLDERQGRQFVEYTEDDDKENDSQELKEEEIEFLPKEEISRKRKLKQTARKSTAKPSQASSAIDSHYMISNLLEEIVSIDVEQVPDLSRVKPKEFTAHRCTPLCVHHEFEAEKPFDRNPFHIPIQVGYRREFIITSDKKKKVVYRGPCGRRLRDIYEVLKYLQITNSGLDIDLFTFRPQVQLFRKSEPLKAFFYVPDITNGLEDMPISCVNTINSQDLGNVIYRHDRFPHKDVHIENIFEDGFLACCDCTDNCSSDECACKRLTFEASETLPFNRFQTYGYEYKRLNDFVLTAIYECNKKCSCNEKCSNKVVQNGIKCRLQLFRTLKKGWGVRVLHDVPKGTFLCTYAAQILNEEAADQEGKTFGDEYLADLDYIDICENQKEGYESDVELSDEDYKDSDENENDDDDDDDDDYKCNFSKSKKGKLSRSTTSCNRDKEVDNKNIIWKGRRNDNKKLKKFSIREDFYKEDFCYSLDAKHSGNIGRYLNHSCEPNCFVQNVFVDTHDMRFPWVSFFAKKDIMAYEELTWDYNYEIGSISDRKMYCFCGAHRCKKRLL